MAVTDAPLPIVTLDDIAEGRCVSGLDDTGHPTAPATVLDLDRLDALTDDTIETLATLTATVLVGVAERDLPDEPLIRRLIDRLDVVLAPSDPVRASAGTRRDLPDLVATVSSAPLASLVLVDLLQTTGALPVQPALAVEAWAYSTLLGGAEFRAWRSRTPPRRRHDDADEPPTLVRRHRDTLEITLARPARRNALDRSMRDALVDDLDVALLDPTIEHVVVRGAGPDFCSGGDLDEFGTTEDLALAAAIRVERSPARAVHRLGGRVTCHVHGACVGAGVELPSLAGTVTAEQGAWFMLPELSMGLVPGAGGTVGLPRRIGRWRTAYMALTGARIDLDTAVSWGLVDERV